MNSSEIIQNSEPQKVPNQDDAQTNLSDQTSNTVQNLGQNATQFPKNEVSPQKYELKEKIEGEDLKKNISNDLQQPPQLIQQSSSQKSSSQSNRLKDYERIREIGRGAYGIVYKVRNKKGQYLAMKEVNSINLKKDKKTHQVYMEKIMRHFKFPGIPEFHSCFTYENYFYFLMALAEGGQLSKLIKRYHQYLTFEVVQFYVAEMVLTLEYIHSLGFSHRDFKPENFVLKKDGHLYLIDFGTLNDYCKKLIPPQALSEVKLKDEYRRSKIKNEVEREAKKRKQESMQSNETNGGDTTPQNHSSSNSGDPLSQSDKDEIENRLRSSTFCGTAEYLCPEMFEDNICDMNGDLWALGCIIYKLFTNKTPFVDTQEYLIFNKIKQGNYNRNHEQIPPVARDLISKLLVIDQHERLGSVQVDEHITKQTVHEAYSKLKAHPFFEGISWDNIFKQDAPELVQQIFSGQFDLIRKSQQEQLKGTNPNGTQNKNSIEVDEEDDDDDDDDENEEEDEVDLYIKRQANNLENNNNNTTENQNNNNNRDSNQAPKSANLIQQSPDRKSQKIIDNNSGTAGKNNSYDPPKSPISGSERYSTSSSSCNYLNYQEVLQLLKPPFTEANLYFQNQINKVNKKLLIFSVKRPRQILLFNNDPITIIYYIPYRSKVNLKYIILDERTTISLESPNRIVLNDQQDKYIFENPKQDTPQQLYQAIQNLKQLKIQQQQQQQQQQ